MPKPTAATSVVEELLDGCLERLEQVFLRLARVCALAPLAARRRRRRRGPRGSSFRRGRRRSRRGSAKARLPYRPAWPRETSPTASTAADARRARSHAAEHRARRPTQPRARRRRAPKRRPGWGLVGRRSASCGLSRPGSSSGASRLPRRSQRRAGGERAARRGRGRAREARRLAPLQPDDDPPARHRRRRTAGPRRRAPLRLDDARAHRPATHRLSYLSIPRDLRVEIPGYGDVEDQRGVPDRRPGAGDRDGEGAHRPARSTTSSSSTSTGSRSSSTRSAGSRSTCRSRSSRTSSTARTSRSAAPTGRAGASRRASSTWTDGARSSTRASARTSSTRPSPTSRAASASRPWPMRSGTRSRASATFLRLPFIGGDLAAPLATDLSAWELAQLGWVRFRVGRHAPLPPRRRADDDRRRVADPRVRGQRAVISMWLGRTAPLAAAEGDALRRRLHAALAPRESGAGFESVDDFSDGLSALFARRRRRLAVLRL